MIILWLLKLGITMLIHNKDDIEFVTELPRFWDTLYVRFITVPLSDDLFPLRRRKDVFQI